jgi:molybdopterin biosynthesis enzyme MoaB
VAKGLHKHAAEEAGQLRTQSRTIAGYSGAKVALQLSGASSAKRQITSMCILKNTELTLWLIINVLQKKQLKTAAQT